MTTATIQQPGAAAIRASDGDRERAIELLREHWLAGRLTLEEYEQRCDEAAGGRFLDDLTSALRELPLAPREPAVTAAQPPPVAPAATARQTGGAAAAIALGALSLLGALLSFGMLFVLTLPASTWAWSLGRRARRVTSGPTRTLATVGEVLGIVATAIGCLALTACAAIITLA